MLNLPNNSEEAVTLGTISNFIDTANLNDDILVFDATASIAEKNIYPIRLDGMTLMLCNEGEGKITIDLCEYELKRNTIVVIQPKNYLQLIEQSESFKVSFIICSLHIIEDILPKLTDLLPVLLHNRINPVTNLTEEEANTLREYYAFLHKQLLKPSTPFLKNKVICLLQAALFQLMEIQTHHNEGKKFQNTRKEEIMAKFIIAVSEHFRERKPVTFYADSIGITAKHLSAMVKEISGRTASEWIENYVLMEAKVLLKTTDLTIQEISQLLSFSNQSFFGKYFKNLTGQSPTDYRKSN